METKQKLVMAIWKYTLPIKKQENDKNGSAFSKITQGYSSQIVFFSILGLLKNL